MHRWIAVGLLAATLAACDGGTGTLSDIRSVDDLRARFTQDAGTTRIVLLLSPT